LEPTWIGSELGAWNELGAWSLERLEPDPRRTQVSIFFWCLFCLFVCGAALHKIRSIVAQLHKQHLLLLCVARKEEEEEGDGIAFFFFFFFFVLWSYCNVAASLHVAELVATLQRRSTLRSPCSAVALELVAALQQAPSSRTTAELQRNSTLRSSMAQLHAASAPRKRRQQLLLPSSSGCFGPFFFWLLCFKK